MRKADEERFDTLITWARSHGASLHRALEVYKDDVTGFSMRVRQNLSSDEINLESQDEILSCPLATSLSYLNANLGGPLLANAAEPTEAGPAFPPAFMKLAPHVIGRFYFIQQYLLGKSSFWHPYIATLPQPDVLSSWSLPPFWPEDDAAFLEGTNTGIAAETIREQLKTEYKEARRVLKEANFPNWQDYTRHLHNWAFSMFVSRAFRPSLVMPKAVRGVELPSGVAIDDFGVLLPVFDIINHSMQAQVRWLVDDDVSNHTKSCRFQTFDTYQPGEQVFNNYGRKTNSELFLSYGFIIPETEELHNDYVHVRKKAESAPQVSTAAGSTAIPLDFLVSLRPANDPSSYVARHRQEVAKDADFDLKPEFAHVEDSLVWDLCLTVVGPENQASFMDVILGIQSGKAGESAVGHTRDQELNCLRQILSASATIPAAVSQVLDNVQNLLLAKLGRDYEKLCETEPGVSVDEDGNEVVLGVLPKNTNQEVAMRYRAQLTKVLENAISALAPDWQNQGEEI